MADFSLADLLQGRTPPNTAPPFTTYGKGSIQQTMPALGQHNLLSRLAASVGQPAYDMAQHDAAELRRTGQVPERSFAELMGVMPFGPFGSVRIPNPIRGWHGSPRLFDHLDLRQAGSAVGLGQGRGAYLSSSPDVAIGYMGGASSRGHLYDADIHATPDQLIRWDDQFARQPEFIKRAIDDAFRQSGHQPFSTWTGNRGRASDQFRALENAIGGEEAARAMAERGVAGVVFPEYRGVNSYSIFSPDDTVQIMRRHDAPLPPMAEILRRYDTALADAAVRAPVRIPNPIRAYHGSPYAFTQFDPRHIGSGEGGVMEVPGFHYSESEGFSGPYRLARGNGPGHMYQVDIHATPEQFLDFTSPWGAQSDLARSAFAPYENLVHAQRSTAPMAEVLLANPNSDQYLTPEMATTLANRGLAGVRYRENGITNHIVFPEQLHLVEILRRYGIAAPVAGGAAAASLMGDQQQQ
jgi:hypothetical protein